MVRAVFQVTHGAHPRWRGEDPERVLVEMNDDRLIPAGAGRT